MTNLVDSALEFWLTSGRYTDQFEKQLADYLGIDRSAMCNELSKMQRDGVIRYEKNDVTLRDR